MTWVSIAEWSDQQTDPLQEKDVGFCTEMTPIKVTRRGD